MFGTGQRAQPVRASKTGVRLALGPLFSARGLHRSASRSSPMRLPTLAVALLVAAPLAAGPEKRVPGERWLRYADPAEAGFDVRALEAARATWEGLPSSAFLVIADGAV